MYVHVRETKLFCKVSNNKWKITLQNKIPFCKSLFLCDLSIFEEFCKDCFTDLAIMFLYEEFFLYESVTNFYIKIIVRKIKV